MADYRVLVLDPKARPGTPPLHSIMVEAEDRQEAVRAARDRVGPVPTGAVFRAVLVPG